jgi:glycosyltransferase involved in cell wall biosynthesis
MLSSVKFIVKNSWRWLGILLARKSDLDKISVFYGFDHIPSLHEVAQGGIVKFQRMQHVLPNTARHFNLVYLVSSMHPPDWAQLLWLSRRKRIRLVWNQDGVGYPGWHGPGWERVNKPMAEMMHAADYVFFQSRFCKLGSDIFLGKRQGPWEILYNAVNTDVFKRSLSDPDPQHLVLLLGGNQYQYYRLETAFRTLAILARQRKDVRLLVAGRLNWMVNEAEANGRAKQVMSDLGIGDRVEFLGPYTQEQAPGILQRAHILLHTKYNDPCPGVVIEAMACGLPVVYSESGGVPELVGKEAGIGIPTPLSWERDLPLNPEDLAEGVLRVADNRAKHADAARQRAVEFFDLRQWLKRHYEVFENLLNQ